MMNSTEKGSAQNEIERLRIVLLFTSADM